MAVNAGVCDDEKSQSLRRTVTWYEEKTGSIMHSSQNRFLPLGSACKGLSESLVPAILTIALGMGTIATTAVPSAQAQAKGASGLPLPRFVSLKAKRVNMRVGPGLQYKVDWMFTKPGLPLEVLKEYDNWRKVRDADGAEGWINQSLLSGRRTALVAPWKAGEKGEYLPLVAKPGEDDSRLVAKMEPGVLTHVEECKDGWCKVEVDNTVTGSVSGYTRQNQLWGVYPDETLD